MSACTLQFVRNSPLRTTLVDESTGHAKYKIDTPIKMVRSVTRIRKFHPSTQPPVHQDEDDDSDPGDDITDTGNKKPKEGGEDKEEEHQTEAELSETSDEIARIYWNWFTPDRIIFQGRITDRGKFLPKAGKMEGQVNSRDSYWRHG